jgi:hypothetical protein
MIKVEEVEKEARGHNCRNCKCWIMGIDMKPILSSPYNFETSMRSLPSTSDLMLI